MSLLNEDFLLTTAAAKKLYHEHAEHMPIIDYHCHLNPQDIYENKNYPTLTQVWINDGMAGDHYKWRLERANGVPEELITGNGDAYEKMVAWAGTIEKAIGNPLYEWTNLELKRFFGIDKALTVKNVPYIWKKANELLQTGEFTPRNLIKNANVKVLCTTDDAISDLKYHQLLAKEEGVNGFRVLPAMRPDALVNINPKEFGGYLNKLGELTHTQIQDVPTLEQALEKRFAFFDSLGGHLSDIGLNSYHYRKMSSDEVSRIIVKACDAAAVLSAEEVDGYQTLLLTMLMKLNKKYNWTMQLHLNVLRNNNSTMFAKIGVDKGYDSVGSQAGISNEIMKMLNDGNELDAVPQLILYSTNANDWKELATGMQCF